MPVEAEVIYKSKEQIVADMVTAIMSRIANVWVEEDGNIRLFFEVLAGEIEGEYLANQLLRDDIWIQRANTVALRLHGEQYGLPIKAGTVSTGTLRFTGAGGVLVPAGSEVAYDPGVGDPAYFISSEDATIPNPGIPQAPTITDAGTGGNPPVGTYEGVVTFITLAGETLAGGESDAVILSVAHQISWADIPIGGPGTTGRRLYRQRDGAGYQLVTTINDNSTTTYTDNVADGSLGGSPPSISTAEQVTVPGESESPGADFNAAIGSITTLTDVPDGITDVTNTTAFVGGSDEQNIDDYRASLLAWVRAPKTGSPTDIKVWSEEVEGVETATVLENDNLGTPTNGHVTVRISGPGGTIPDSEVQDAVLAALELQDIANITFHIGTFTAVDTDVDVDVAAATGYTLLDIEDSIVQAISDYINAVPTGGTVYAAGIIDAVFGLPGVENVTTTFTDTTHTTTQKPVPGVIGVS